MRKAKWLLLAIFCSILMVCSFSKNSEAVPAEGEAEKACDYSHNEWLFPSEDFDVMKCIEGCYNMETNIRIDARRMCCWDNTDNYQEEQCYFFLGDYFAFSDELYEIDDAGYSAVLIIQ